MGQCSCHTKLKRFNFRNREKGQFNTKVQSSLNMTEMDIKRLLVETFPFLSFPWKYKVIGAADNTWIALDRINPCNVLNTDSQMFTSMKTSNTKQTDFSSVLGQQLNSHLGNNQTILTQWQTFEFLHLAFYLELQKWRSGVSDLTSPT